MGVGILLVALSFGLFTAKDMIMPPQQPICKVEYIAQSTPARTLDDMFYHDENQLKGTK